MIDDRTENQWKWPTRDKRSSRPSRNPHFESLYRQCWRSIGASYRASTLSPFLQANHERIVWSTGVFIHNERRRERGKTEGLNPLCQWMKAEEWNVANPWVNLFWLWKEKSEEQVYCETFDVNRKKNTNELAWSNLPLPRTRTSTLSFLIA